MYIAESVSSGAKLVARDFSDIQTGGYVGVGLGSFLVLVIFYTFIRCCVFGACIPCTLCFLYCSPRQEVLPVYYVETERAPLAPNSQYYSGHPHNHTVVYQSQIIGTQRQQQRQQQQRGYPGYAAFQVPQQEPSRAPSRAPSTRTAPPSYPPSIRSESGTLPPSYDSVMRDS
ncbi:hypothetical protein V1512DRAFT_290419 [Lipomyces arxii]|uniref:uncharacterized protein n=1 Tax=Lipomyces arxii TaxID=56418 RepID=UPI0034CEF214